MVDLDKLERQLAQMKDLQSVAQQNIFQCEVHLTTLNDEIKDVKQMNMQVCRYDQNMKESETYLNRVLSDIAEVQ